MEETITMLHFESIKVLQEHMSEYFVDCLSENTCKQIKKLILRMYFGGHLKLDEKPKVRMRDIKSWFYMVEETMKHERFVSMVL